MTLSTVPKFKFYIENLLSLYEVKEDILDYSKYLKILSGVFIVLIHSINLKNFINVILTIANEINIQNYQNKILYFDFKSLDNVIEMKNKSKKIFDLISKYYFIVSNGENILNSNTKNNIEYLINKLNSNLEKNSEKLKEKFNLHYENMINSISDEKVKEELKKEFIVNFYESIFNEEVLKVEEKMIDLKKQFINYFMIKCNEENFEINLLQILNVLIKIDDNLKEYAITNIRPIEINKRKIEKKENINNYSHKKSSSISLINKENKSNLLNINRNGNKPFVSVLSSKYNL